MGCEYHDTRIRLSEKGVNGDISGAYLIVNELRVDFSEFKQNLPERELATSRDFENE